MKFLKKVLPIFLSTVFIFGSIGVTTVSAAENVSYATLSNGKTVKITETKLHDDYDFGSTSPTPRYDNGVCIVSSRKTGSLKFGLIDKYGNTIAPLIYDRIHIPHEGLFHAEKDSKFGFIDSTGKEVIPFTLEAGIPSSTVGFWDGLSRLYDKEDNAFYIDKTGKIVIPTAVTKKYRFVGDFSDDMAQAWKESDWNSNEGFKGYMDKSGQLVIPYKYTDAGSFAKGVAVVGVNGKYGIIDKTGKELTPLKYDSINNEDFVYRGADVMIVSVNGKYGLIDKTGKELTPIKYDYIDITMTDTIDPSKDLIKVVINDKSGYIDYKGNEVIPFIYGNDKTSTFDKGLASVTLNNGDTMFIDKSGKNVYPFFSGSSISIDEELGFAILRGRDYSGVMDLNGNVIFPTSNEMIFPLNSDLFKVIKSDLMGVIDRNRNIIIEAEYSGLNEIKLADDTFSIIAYHKDSSRSMIVIEYVSNTNPVVTNPPSGFTASAKAVEYKKANQGVESTNKPSLATHIKINVDGKIVQLKNTDGSDMYAMSIDDRTFLPMRSLAEAVGLPKDNVQWDNANGIAYVASKGKTAEMWTNSNKMIIDNGTVIDIQKNEPNVKVFAYEGRTYLPVRSVAENALGMTVDWSGGCSTVYISTTSKSATDYMKEDDAKAPVTPTPAPTPKPSTPGEQAPDYSDRDPNVNLGETKPTKPGTTHREKSPGGGWSWNANTKEWVPIIK